MIRSAVVPVRFAPEERNALIEQAKKFGVSLSEFVRRAALGRRMPPMAAPEINRETYQQLCRIGNNLNQVARRIHEGSIRVEGELSTVLLELRGALKEVGMKVLGAEKEDDSEAG